jgi:GTP-binding protein
MFVDKVQIKAKAGKGGNGAVSFRREKYVERGGPDGGDGGDGGDIIALASNSQNTLASFRYKKEITAEPGQDGDKRKKHGKNGKDLLLKLPVGTVVSNAQGDILTDLVEDGQQVVIAQGGKGGYGNAHFVSSRRQAPRVSEKGEPGEEFELTFELKMIADVGLVGLPNAGKSTLLSRISNARPEIANYPFTTLRPNLGVVDIDGSTSVLFADIPGLIEGASQGKGLGDEFLRHVERTKLLIHLIDGYHEDVVAAYKTIQKELASYSVDLSKRPQIIALNKTDGLDEEIISDQLAKLKKAAGAKTKTFAVSGQSGQGLKELLFEAKKAVGKATKKPKKASRLKSSLPIISLRPTGNRWEAEKAGDGKFVVTGPKIERFAKRTVFESYEGIIRLKDIMRKMGIIHDLERKGIQPGDEIQMGKDNIGSFKY